MTDSDSAALERAATRDSIEIEPRTRRALERVASVTPDIGRARDAPGMALVTSGNSGNSYLVDVRDGRCECPDAQHRDPDGGCWHVRRARMAMGAQSIPADAVAQLDVDPGLGEHTDATLQWAAADGGVVTADDADADDDTDECDECAELADGWPCARCYVDGDAEFDTEVL